MGAARVWLFNLSSGTALPLFAGDQTVSAAPRWSPEGSRLAVFSLSERSIIVHDMIDSSDVTQSMSIWALNAFSPDGKFLLYEDLLAIPIPGSDLEAGGAHLRLLDLTTTPYQSRGLVPDTLPVDDAEAIWRADSKRLIVARKPPAATNPRPSEIDSLDVATGEARLLLPAENRTQSLLSLSPADDLLAVQRQGLDLKAPPEIAVVDLASTQVKTSVADATVPGWLP